MSFWRQLISEPSPASSQQSHSEDGMIKTWTLTKHKPEIFSPVPALSLVVSDWDGKFPLERHQCLVKAFIYLLAWWFTFRRMWIILENKKYSTEFYGAFSWEKYHSVTRLMNKNTALPFFLQLQLCRKDESLEEVWKPPRLIWIWTQKLMA